MSLERDLLENCPACERSLAGSGIRPLSGFARDHIVRCRACGFHFSLAIPSEEDLARVYGVYDYAGEDEGRTDINIAKEQATARELMDYRRTGRVLDIAAGAGRFLEHFRDEEMSCFATEFNEQMMQFLAAKGFTVLPGGLFPQAAAPDMFDIVVFTEIIEHINNPMPVLRNIHSIVRPGGCIYVTTPNFNSLERRLLGQDWGMICWPEHITYWTPRDLHRALTRAGFRRRSLRVENISPFRIIQALKKGRLKSVVGDVSEQSFSDMAQRRVARSRLLSGVKKFVNAGLNATRMGSSIRAIYERPQEA